jgi:hypothetical protein
MGVVPVCDNHGKKRGVMRLGYRSTWNRTECRRTRRVDRLVFHIRPWLVEHAGDHMTYCNGVFSRAPFFFFFFLSTTTPFLTNTTPFAIDLAVATRFNLFSMTWQSWELGTLVSHKVDGNGEVGAIVIKLGGYTSSLHTHHALL